MQLAGKTVLLTGASGGIGRCLALQLAQAGARLILVGRGLKTLEALCASLAPVDQPHRTLVADLRQQSEREALAVICSDLQVDILINNAGAGEFNWLEDSSSEAITDLLELNLNVPIQLTRLLLPVLKTRPEAAVINIGSALGSIGYPGYSVYSASKFGLRGFSEALRRELADTAVQVMHLSPRATRTALNSNRVVAMNEAMGVAMDAPEYVARTLVERIREDRWSAQVLGWPERFYAWVNACAPAMTDGSIRKQLARIRGFAQNSDNRQGRKAGVSHTGEAS
ncbi:MAG: SDR family oxidoreductase [Pseudomonadales bacterium]|nr:SDR family oxidoreductase [Pseudomonadales bacterium]MCP5330089.1 SDR family oxidoreductase [Pseudomonadales bacterium]MCP5343001.1 SDR family oxidoreductase [Pseudomonadales bacterium]